MGSLNAFEKGQDGIYRDLRDVKELISQVKEKVAILERCIEENKIDINNIGAKITEIKEDQEKWQRERSVELKTTIRNYTVGITTIIGLFLTFLGLWMKTPSTRPIIIDKEALSEMVETDGTSDNRYPGPTGEEPR